MAADKPILEIEIDDAAFKGFQEKFGAYKAACAQMPEAWGKADSHASDLAAGFEAMVAKMAQANAAINDLAEGARQAGGEQLAAGQAWDRLRYGSKRIGADIYHSTLSLAKWAGLTTLFSSILAGGGLFGISRLAMGVSSRRTSAMGMGLDYGEAQSYGVNFDRLGNASGMLAGFNAAMTSGEGQGALVSLLGPNADRRMAGKDAAGLIAEALPDIKRLVNNTDPRQLGNVLKARGLDRLGIDLNTAETIGRMSPSEINETIAGFHSDIGSMNLTKENQLNWQNFETQIERAGAVVGNRFADNLSHIAPGLTRLSAGLSDLVGVMLKDGGPIDGWIKKANTGLMQFAGYIETRGFQTKVENFVKDSAAVGHIIGKITEVPWWAFFHIARDFGEAGADVLNSLTGQPRQYGTKNVPRPPNGQHTPEERAIYNWILGPTQGSADGTPSRGASLSDAAHAHRGASVKTPDQSTWLPNDGGAPTNYGDIKGRANQDRGQWGGIGQNLVMITDQQGNKATVNASAAPHFESFLKDLEASGYSVHSLGGYNPRYKTNGGGWSQHAYGNAIDINPYANPFGGGKSDMPEGVSVIAARNGLSWGGDWRGTKDPMHFEYTGVEPKFDNPSTNVAHVGKQNRIHIDNHADGDVETHTKEVGPMSYAPAFGNFQH